MMNLNNNLHSSCMPFGPKPQRQLSTPTPTTDHHNKDPRCLSIFLCYSTPSRPPNAISIKCFTFTQPPTIILAQMCHGQWISCPQTQPWNRLLGGVSSVNPESIEICRKMVMRYSACKAHPVSVQSTKLSPATNISQIMLKSDLPAMAICYQELPKSNFCFSC